MGQRLGIYIRKHATDLVDQLKFASLVVLEVHARVPVAGHILANTACRAVTGLEARGVDLLRKACFMSATAQLSIRFRKLTRRAVNCVSMA